MTIEDCFEVPEEGRVTFIERNIIVNLPEDARESARSKITKIVTDFAGQDFHALYVLAYSSQQGRFDEFFEKLEKHYEESLQYVAPEARRNALFPGALRTKIFFLGCYKSLGIKKIKSNG